MNYMDKVAEMLGVETLELFEIECNYGMYMINSAGLIKDHAYCDNILRLLLNGTLKIKRKTWKPKHGETYWYPNPYCESTACATTYSEIRHSDILCAERGLAFKTKEEAIEASEKMLNALEVEQ